MSEIPKQSTGAPLAPAAAVSSGAEKRRHARFDYSVPVFVRVLVEEETFNPLRFSGRSRNISRGGMLVQIPNLTESDYRRLILRQRMVRVQCQLPEIRTEAVFFGKIVWYDYRSSEAGPTCSLGIAFEQLHEKEEKMLSELLRKLEAGATSPQEVVSLE
ncbi:MAG: PilZ domain-containing protein [Candidatus Sumerlaeia bacterium]|nr:PilZ domain-containing protein [Candidatus Sumerlaeia bacterium]